MRRLMIVLVMLMVMSTRGAMKGMAQDEPTACTDDSTTVYNVFYGVWFNQVIPCSQTLIFPEKGRWSILPFPAMAFGKDAAYPRCRLNLKKGIIRANGKKTCAIVISADFYPLPRTDYHSGVVRILPKGRD